jgi:shikimate kinase
MNVVLIGFMASGKTTAGKLLAKRLGWAFYDSDAEVERRRGKRVAEIFAQEGEPAFRELEKVALRGLAGQDNAVISTGGGVPLLEENMRTLEQKGFIVLLTAKPETVLERLKAEPSARPLLAGKDPAGAVRELLAARARAYDRHHWAVVTDGRTPEQVAEKIFEMVKEKIA